jgi:hypothetical protein
MGKFALQDLPPQALNLMQSFILYNIHRRRRYLPTNRQGDETWVATNFRKLISSDTYHAFNRWRQSRWCRLKYIHSSNTLAAKIQSVSWARTSTESTVQEVTAILTTPRIPPSKTSISNTCLQTINRHASTKGRHTICSESDPWKVWTKSKRYA